MQEFNVSVVELGTKPQWAHVEKMWFDSKEDAKKWCEEESNATYKYKYILMEEN